MKQPDVSLCISCRDGTIRESLFPQGKGGAPVSAGGGEALGQKPDGRRHPHDQEPQLTACGNISSPQPIHVMTQVRFIQGVPSGRAPGLG